ncbi:MAG TPA: hypothetical protein VJR89_24880, partial [Polyangiales bacterium]|nr:hypothetical protein [Polyangiales bacterium]
QLLGIHYMSAAHLAALGQRALASEEIARALQLAPTDRNVLALAAAIHNGDGPVPIEPFLRF